MFMKVFSSLALVAILGVLFLNSCSKQEEAVDYVAVDKKIIEDYIADNSLTAEALGNGLYMVMSKEGVGKSPGQYSDIQIRYKGYLTDGTTFDESSSTGIRINLSRVIAGWQQGVPEFKEGGEGMLLIPSYLGYGGQATGSIPANSVLIFDIKLLEVYQ